MRTAAQCMATYINNVTFLPTSALTIYCQAVWQRLLSCIVVRLAEREITGRGVAMKVLTLASALVCGLILSLTDAHADSGLLSGLGGKCVSVKGGDPADGTPLILWSCHGQADQQWELQANRTLRGLAGKCASVNGGNPADGTNLILWPCHGQADQQWELQADGTLRGLAGKCVDAAGANSADGTPLILWPCNSQPNQQWSGPPQSSPIFNSHLNEPGKPLRGFVDLHTHPMAHLGFGGHVVYGAPDVQVMMPAGAIYDRKGIGLSGSTCNKEPRPAENIQEALGTSYSSHGGHDFLKNKCGNHIRAIVLPKMMEKYHSNITSIEHSEGHPSFRDWPAYNDILHQQMWWEWIKRAKEGGLRVMVALAVNNYTLASGLEAQPPIDDQTVGKLQIEELIKFVGRHEDFMRMAYSAQDLRRIVESDKLAVVIGVELDDIGNMLKNNVSPTEDMVRREIRELHRLGVRYAFPVHVIDNRFGGTAAYEAEFARANRYQAGHWWDLTCSGGEGITRRVDLGWDVFKLLKLGGAGGEQPVPTCSPGDGHKNKLGLSPMGRVAIDEMMALGMLIDIDHMSQQTANETIDHTGRMGDNPADQYPVVSGHNGLRGVNPEHNSENQRTSKQYGDIAARGGIAGVGFGASNAPAFLRDANAVAALGISVNFGSDINGLVELPHSPECRTTPCVQYNASFPQARMGEKVWDYNRDGVAHIGLFPDFLKHVENLPGGAPLVNKLYNGAEAFARMWEKAGQVSKKILPPSSPTAPVVPIPHPPAEEPTKPDCPPSLPRCQPN